MPALKVPAIAVKDAFSSTSRKLKYIKLSKCGHYLSNQGLMAGVSSKLAAKYSQPLNKAFKRTSGYAASEYTNLSKAQLSDAFECSRIMNAIVLISFREGAAYASYYCNIAKRTFTMPLLDELKPYRQTKNIHPLVR